MKIHTNIGSIASYKKYLEVKDATLDFLKKNTYLELELPVLSPALVPESYLEVFETEYRYMNNREKLYLTPSPELFIKRLLANGIGDCFYLGKSFRNAERHSERHGSEFTMLEFYKTNATYLDISNVTLNLLQHIAESLLKKKTIIYNGTTVSLERWDKMTVDESFITYAHLEAGTIFDEESLRDAAKQKGYVTDGFSYEDIFSQMYVHEVEPHLGMNGFPTMLYDYPKEFAALAQLNGDSKTAQRFEFYIAGVELGDCYTELTDPIEQKKRFVTEDNKRKQDNKINHPVDWGFVEALEKGLPACSGIAIGFDRLAMVFADVPTIHDLKVVEVW